MLRQLLDQAQFGSQAELAEALAGEGFTVSQPTLSKDLLELGAVRQRAADGSLVYAAADAGGGAAAAGKLARSCAELVVSMRHAGTQILLKTPPGAAQYFASHVDAAGLRGLLGTIAGDDTVLLIATCDEAAEDIVAAISEMTKTGRVTEGLR